MQELEKILEEIDTHAIEFEAFGISDDYVSVGWAKEIIRKHMNDGWISVEERLPEDLEDVLVDFGDECPTIAWYSKATKMWEDSKAGSIIRGVIAWCPLPEPYKPPEERKSSCSE